MPKKVNKYQYETSPRKIAPDYTPPKKAKEVKKNTASKPKTSKKIVKASINTTTKQKVIMITYIIIGFLILFAISYRNSQIDENFAKVQSLKQELSELEKENAQLEISIDNGLNLTIIEQQAKELLGMQKLTSRQTVYVSLPKQDYIETASEEVMLEEKTSIFESIMNTFMSIFK